MYISLRCGGCKKMELPYYVGKNGFINVTRSAKRGLIAFLNFQLQLVTAHNVLSLLMQNCDPI